MKKESSSVEFFCPDQGFSLEEYLESGDMSAVHHLARYMWVRGILPQKGAVLDVACGSGYGSYMIAIANPDLSVTGVDYDRRAIEIAKGRFSAPNLSFRTGDIVNWAYEDGENLGRFDCVVSFDTLEHILHREIALINIAENLATAGSLFFSTPSGHRSPLLNPAWEHHKIEYSGSYLYNLMSRFFGKVLTPDDGSLPDIQFWRRLNGKKVIYWNRMNPIVAQSPIQRGLNW